MSNIEEFARVEQEFAGLSAGARAALVREMETIGRLLTRRAKDLIRDQFKVRSGKLLRSPTATVQEGADEIQLIFGTVGVPYASAHEFGTTISIPEYQGSVMRFVAASGDLVFTRHRRAYTVTLPERSFIRRAVDESRPEIDARLRRAVGE